MNNLNSAERKEVLRKLVFVQDLITNYFHDLTTVQIRHGFSSAGTAKAYANDVCKQIAPELMNEIYRSCNTTYLSLSKLRSFRNRLLPEVNHAITILKNLSHKETNMIANQNNTEIKTEIKNEQTPEKKENKNMQIQDLVKLRRLVSSSLALTSLLENVYIQNEVRFAEHSHSPQHLIIPQPNNASDSMPSWIKNNSFTQTSAPVSSNPYAEIHLTKKELDAADAKFLELMEILFPYSENTQS